MTYFKKSIKENFDTMKKNVMLKIASVLMVAVLLTTCAISSTFAKYVTTGPSVENEATAAKWGIKITAKGTDTLFQNTYKTNSNKVIAAGADNNFIVAPGTSYDGTGFGISITGKPEVAVDLILELYVDISNWNVKETAESTDASKFYFPVELKVGDVDITGATEEAIEAEITKQILMEIFGMQPTPESEKTTEGYFVYKKTYAANTDFDKEVDSDLLIDWAWDFSNGETYDFWDTQLGDAAAKGTNVPTINISYNLKAVQSAEGVAPATQG
jgi:hypothetical protein